MTSSSIAKPEYLRHILGAGCFAEYASAKYKHVENKYFQGNQSLEGDKASIWPAVCEDWANHLEGLKQSLPEREQNAVKAINEITRRGSLVISAEMGHINSGQDFSHSYLQLLVPRDMVPTYELELETHGELQVNFIDAEKEIAMRREERFLNEQQKLNYLLKERKTTVIAQVVKRVGGVIKENYINFHSLAYPLDEVNMLPEEIRDDIANNYVCMNIAFIESCPETMIDFILAPLHGILFKK